MKIGCHAVLFAGEIVNNTVHVLASLHDAGAEGAEIGSRFFGLDRSGELGAVLEKSRMQLSGLHAGSPLTFALLLDDPKTVEQGLVDTARFLQNIPCKNIITTGLPCSETVKHFDAPNLGDDRLTTPEGARLVAENFNKIAARLKQEFGIQINYHNHNWEFKNDAVIFNALVKYAPDVNFALDVGWAAVAGYDPIKIIEETCKGRVHYVHLRDYDKSRAKGCEKFEEFQACYVDLGEGDTDLKALLSVVEKAVGQDGWAVVEYERGPVDAKRYEKAVTYVRGLLKELHEQA